MDTKASSYKDVGEYRKDLGKEELAEGRIKIWIQGRKKGEVMQSEG